MRSSSFSFDERRWESKDVGRHVSYLSLESLSCCSLTWCLSPDSLDEIGSVKRLSIVYFSRLLVETLSILLRKTSTGMTCAVEYDCAKSREVNSQSLEVCEEKVRNALDSQDLDDTPEEKNVADWCAVSLQIVQTRVSKKQVILRGLRGNLIQA